MLCIHVYPSTSDVQSHHAAFPTVFTLVLPAVDTQAEETQRKLHGTQLW